MIMDQRPLHELLQMRANMAGFQRIGRSDESDGPLDMDDHHLLANDPKGLSPTSTLVFKQWVMDDENTLLVNGFSRRTQCQQILPEDICIITADYYVKLYSKNNLNMKIEAAENLKMEAEWTANRAGKF